jgi:capsular exopolysaccharide synthesis family protein
VEPIDYLKILQRHWKVAAGLIVVMLAATFLLAPDKPAPNYEARHTLLRDSASGNEGASSTDNPSVVALWASAGEVPERVAAKLGYDGPVDDLIGRLTVTPNIELGTVEMVATSKSSEEAVLLVNTFAEEVLVFIGERDTARVEQARAAAATRTTEIQQEIARLNTAIAAAGGDENPAAAALVAERSGLTGELQLLGTDEANARASTQWASLQTATSAQEAAGSVTGRGRGQWLILTAIVAIILSFGVAIMLDRSDSRLHTKEQVERQFGLPVLAEVPLLPIRIRHRAAVYGYEHDNRLAEAYRSLRTALLLFRDRLPLEVEAAELSGRPGARGSVTRQVILVTSAEAGDGKSTTAANLAVAYAEAGQSVLLVNWDLWRPIPAKVFDAEDEPGVSEFLEAGNASLVRYVQSTSVPGLHLVPAGKLGHQPGAQLDAELRLLEEARSLADVVIIDTAPLLAASVTRELVTMADVVVLASRAGRTTSPAAERAAELLERLGAPTLGVVLVGVAAGLFNDYYGNPPSRTDRLRTSVMSKVEPRGSKAEPRSEQRYASSRSSGGDGGGRRSNGDSDLFRSSDLSPGRGIDS